MTKASTIAKRALRGAGLPSTTDRKKLRDWRGVAPGMVELDLIDGPESDLIYVRTGQPEHYVPTRDPKRIVEELNRMHAKRDPEVLTPLVEAGFTVWSPLHWFENLEGAPRFSRSMGGYYAKFVG